MNTFVLFFVAMASSVTCKPAVVSQEEHFLTGTEKISKRSALVEEYSPEETLVAKEPRIKKSLDEELFSNQEPLKIMERAASTAFFRPRFTRSLIRGKREVSDDLETAESNVFMPLFFFRRQNYDKERFYRRRYF